jgi:ankyrin repeat protein
MRVTCRSAATLIAACLTVCGVAGARPLPPQTSGNGKPSATPPPSPAANAYLDAVRRGDLPGIEKALADGVDVDTPFRYDRRALSFAADRGQVEVVRLLLAKGAKVDLADSYYNQTALAWASSPAQTRKPEHAQVVKLLLEKGAKGADRALASAIDEDDLAMVQAVLDVGHLPPAVLSESLAAAKKKNKPELVAVLEKAGAVMPVIPTLTPAQLARYPGTYNDGRNDVTITLKDGALNAGFGQQPLVLSPRSEARFVVETIAGLSITFAFEGDRASTVTVVNGGGGTSVYKRVSQP